MGRVRGGGRRGRRAALTAEGEGTVMERREGGGRGRGREREYTGDDDKGKVVAEDIEGTELLETDTGALADNFLSMSMSLSAFLSRSPILSYLFLFVLPEVGEDDAENGVRLIIILAGKVALLIFILLSPAPEI